MAFVDARLRHSPRADRRACCFCVRVIAVTKEGRGRVLAMGRLMRYSLRKTPRSAKSSRQRAAAVARRGGRPQTPTTNLTGGNVVHEACFPHATNEARNGVGNVTNVWPPPQPSPANARFVPPQNQHLCIGLLTSQIVEGHCSRPQPLYRPARPQLLECTNFLFLTGHRVVLF